MHPAVLNGSSTCLMVSSGLQWIGSFYDLIGLCKQLRRNYEADRLCGIQIAQELRRALQHRQLRRCRTFEHQSAVKADLAPSVRQVGSVAQQTSRFDIFAPWVDRG